MSLADLKNYDIGGGDLSETPFAALLGIARQRQLTGTLDMEREKAHKTIFFLNGIPVYCASDLPGESLRQVAFKSGLLDRARLDEVEFIMETEHIEEDRVLLRLGIFDDSTRYTHLQALARKRILACFQWTAANFRFALQEDFLEAIDLFDIDPLDLIHEGISTYQGTGVALEIQKVSNLEIEPTGDFADIEPFMTRYHSEANLEPLQNGKIKVFQALPAVSKDINCALTLIYELIITGYLAVDGHIPGDSAPELEERPAAASDFSGPIIEEEEEGDFAPELAHTEAGSTSYRVTTRIQEEIIRSAKPKSEPASPEKVNRPAPIPQPKAPPKAPVPPPRFQKKKLRAYDEAPPPKRPLRPSGASPAASGREPGGAPQGPVDNDLLQRFEKMRDMARTEDYYTILGVAIETNRIDIKKAYFNKNQQFHLDRARPLGSLGESISEEITSALQTAYQTLIDPDKRYQYEMGLLKKEQDIAWSMQLRQELAKNQHHRGKWYLGQKRPDLAFSFLDLAVKLDSNQAQYYAFMGWSLYASDKSKSGEAKAFLRTALGINSHSSDVLLLLGWILKDTGDEAEATKSFEKAVQEDPGNLWAKAELGKAASPQKKSDGLFGRLFKK